MQLDLMDQGKPTKTFEARWYQAEAHDAVLADLGTYRSVLVVMATGLGKTVLLSKIVASYAGRVLVLAHRKELIDQLSSTLAAVTGEPVGIEMAESRAGYRHRVVVASVATLHREHRRKHHQPFDLIIIDEAHRSLATSYRKIVDAYPLAKVLGVTATPDRGDKRSLGKLFEHVSYSMGILDGVNAGYLVPLLGKSIEVDGVDLDSVPVVSGDLAVGALDAEIVKGAAVIAERALDICDGQTIIFAPGVKSAHAISAYLEAARPGCSTVVDGETADADREKAIQGYRDGSVQFLCNCMVATEGFDAPGTRYVVLARPTKSRGLHAQMAGRGTRPLPGVVDSVTGRDEHDERRSLIANSAKPHCTLVDMVGNCKRHKLASTIDIFADAYDDETVRRARKISSRSQDAIDPIKVLEQAKLELKRIREAKEARARVREFDPFEVGGEHAGAKAFGGSVPATEKQRATLAKLGLSHAEISRMTKQQANKFLSTAFLRRDKGLASYKQLRYLAKLGVQTPTNISFSHASRLIDERTGGR